MFVTYLLRELRRRVRQSIFIALGLALGVGLVITVTAASKGVSDGQGTVLQSLYGVGTDITVTQSPTAGSGGPQHFTIPGQSSGGTTSVSRDILAGAGMGTLKSSAVSTISGQKDVTAAVGALVLNDIKLSGTFTPGSGGSGSGRPGSGGAASGGSGSGRPGSGGAASGGSGAFSTNSFSVTGVDPSNDSLGPLASGTITSGHNFTSAEANDNVALVDSNYAKAEGLKVGSTITVAGKSFAVVGIVQAGQGVTDSDVYIPLARAQALSGVTGEVNTIYVSAASASDINTVSAEISHALPSATVTTSSDLASEVTGSLASASTLASNLGKWLAVAVLAVTFGLASVLTVSAVARRVREFGTLKAIGWSSRRIIRQVMGEALVIGIAGAAAGVAIGYGAAAIVAAVAPPLTATVGSTPGSGPSAPAGGGFSRAASSAAHTATIHLSTPVTFGAVGLAVLLAIAGGLVAGSFGGWRAVRLRPAAAMTRLE